MKKIMLVGGGSGGHLTPLVAVAQELKEKSPETTVIYVGQTKEDLSDVVAHESIDVAESISAGKFRRYHGESFVSHVLDVRTFLLNVRDFFRFVAGTLQAWRMLGRQKPDAIFLKGGFVSVPVGFAARLRRIPYMTHDSDAIPGLANRLTAKHALYNAVALPVELYPYDPEKTVHVGIPLQKSFKKVSESDKQAFRKSLGVEPIAPMLFSVGGGLGAQKLNDGLIKIADRLLERQKGLRIFHVTGLKLYEQVRQSYKDKGIEDKVDVIDFTTELHKFSGAADVVLTRAGATNIAEFSTQAKACVVVPAPHLTGGQQLHNAKILVEKDAAIVVQEENMHTLFKELDTLLTDDIRKSELETNIHALSTPHSASKIVELLLKIASDREG